MKCRRNNLILILVTIVLFIFVIEIKAEKNNPSDDINNSDQTQTLNNFSNPTTSQGNPASTNNRRFSPADLNVTPQGFELNLLYGTQADRTLRLQNDGEEEVDWMISVEVINEPEGAGNYQDELNNPGPIRDDLGDIIETYSQGEEYWAGIAWDRGSIWGANYINRRINRYDINEEQIVSRINLNFRPLGLDFDGESFWVCNADSSIMNLSNDGDVLESLDAEGIRPVGITWDGENIWYASVEADDEILIQQISAEGEVLRTLDLGEIAISGYSVLEWVPTHEQGHLWVRSFENHVFQLNVEGDEAEVVQEFILEPSPVYGMTHDGQNLWFSEYSSEDLYIVDDGANDHHWMRLTDYFGSIEPDEEKEVNITFNATGLISGEYSALMNVLSSFEDDEIIEVMAILTVEEAPDIEVEWEFGADENDMNWLNYYAEIFTNIDYTIPITISNTGTAVLSVEDISSDEEHFSSEVEELSIEAAEESEIDFIFSSDEIGEYNGEMTIQCDDPDEEEIRINLHARVVHPPAAEIEPLQFEFDLAVGELITETFRITNTGEAALNWETEIEYMEEEERDAHSRNVRSTQQNLVHPGRDAAGDILGEYEIPYPNTQGLTWDGELVWGVSYTDDCLYALNPESGEIDIENATHEFPQSLTFDGAYFYTGDRQNNLLYAYSREGELMEVYNTEEPWEGIASDGINLLFLNAEIGRTIRVLDKENDYEEIGTIDYSAIIERDVDCIEWTPDITNGQLWCISDEHVFQMFVNEDWEPELVQTFEWNGNQEYVGVAYDGANLWHGMSNENTLFVNDNGIPRSNWLEVNPPSGEIEGEANQDVEISVDATWLFTGELQATLHVLTNDPDNEDIEIDVRAEVEGEQHIAVSWLRGFEENTIDWNEYFDPLFRRIDYNIPITIRNTGSDWLEINEISIDNEAFSVEFEGFEIQPLDHEVINILLNTEENGEQEAVLTINSNDPENDEISINLVAITIDPPAIVLTPDEIEEELFTGAILEREIVLANEGQMELIWEASLEIIEDDEALNIRNRSIRSTQANSGIPYRDNPGDVIQRFEVPFENTTGMDWDGELMWGISRSADRLFSLNPEDGEIVDNFNIHNNPTNMTIIDGNFWIGTGWADNVFIWDSEGNQLDQFQMDNFDGLATNGENLLFMNTWDNGRADEIHVYTINNMEQIATIEYSEDVNQRDIDCIVWVPSHRDGALWCLGESRAYQLSVDEDWNAELVQDFALENEQEYDGIAHDGENLWHGSRNDNEWIVFDDGTEEIDWISLEPLSGEVEGNSETNLNLNFDANNMNGGEYRANIEFISNDPDDGIINVPVTLIVEGAADIVVSWEIGLEENVINWNDYFLEVFNNGNYPIELTVRNNGTEALSVDEISFENENFLADPSNFDLDIRDIQIVTLTFSPEESEEIETILVIRNNDPDEEEVVIDILAQSFEPPEIEVQPREVEDALRTGETSEHTVTITNEGEANLRWEITSEITNEPDRDQESRNIRSTSQIKSGPRRDEPGDIIDRYEVPIQQSTGLSWDGELMWGIDYAGRFIALDPISGEIVNNLNIHDNASSLAFTGENFLIGQSWDELIFTYDSEGDLIEEFEFERDLDGITTDLQDFVIANGTNEIFYVLDNEDFEIVAEMNYNELTNGRDIDAMQWVSDHPDGQLWCMAEEYVYQFHVDDNWNLEIAQEFEIECPQEYYGLSHDGENMWHGSAENEWVSFDDGIEEVHWLTLEPEAGELETDAEVDIFIILDAAGLFGGEYRAIVHILSNDPDNEDVEIAVALDITGAPDIDVLWEFGFEENIINFNDYFDEVFRDGEYRVPVTIRNLGTDDLTVENIQSDNDAFSSEQENLDIQPNERLTFDFIFSPEEAEAFEGTMSFTTNDEDEEEFSIDLSGEALVPPNIIVTPDEFVSDLFTGETSEAILNIENNGAAQLRWSLLIEIIEDDDFNQMRRNVRSTDPASFSGPRRDDPGDILETFDVPIASVTGMTCDGELIWGLSFEERRIIALDPEEGEIVSNFQLNFSPLGLGFDGANLWIGNWDNDIVISMNRDGEILDDFNPDIGNINGITFDESNHMLLNSEDRNTIFVYDLDNFEEIATIEYQGAMGNGGNIWSIGWVPEHLDGKLWGNTQGRAFQVSIDNEWNAEAVTNFAWNTDQPYNGIAHDGENLWHGMWGQQVFFMVDDGIEEINWLSIEPVSGILEEDEDEDLFVLFDADRLFGGEYNAIIRVTSNDPDDGDIEIGATLTVTGAPDIFLRWDIGMDENLIDWNAYFDEVYCEGEYSVSVAIINIGTDLLVIEEISCENELFTADLNEADIEPDQGQMVHFIFAPVESGIYESEMIIRCNDPNEDELSINLRAQSFNPPEIIVLPAEIDIELIIDDNAERVISIENDGEADLVWQIQVEFPDNERDVSGKRNIRSTSVQHRVPFRDDPGDILQEFEVPIQTSGLAWDGELMWGVSYESNRLIALNPDDGEIVQNYQLNFQAIGLGFDGENLWIGDWRNERIEIYNREGESIDTFDPDIGDIAGITSDQNGHMLVNSQDEDIIYVYDLEDFRFLRTFQYRQAMGNSDIWSIEWVESHDEGNLWGNCQGRAYQTNVTEDWDVEAVSNFNWNSDEDQAGIAHDGENMWHGMWNERNWFMHDDGIEELRWIDIDPTSGLVESEGDQDVFVIFNAEGLVGGEYLAEIHVLSNDPNDGDIVIPVTLTVIGAGLLSTDPVAFPWDGAQELEFNDKYIEFGRDSLEVTFSCTGTDRIEILRIENNHEEAFSASLAAGTIIPIDESRSFSFAFHPQEFGNNEGRLDIYTTALNVGEGDNVGHIWFDLVGRGVHYSEISTNPDSGGAFLVFPIQELEIERTLTITNSSFEDAPDLRFRIIEELVEVEENQELNENLSSTSFAPSRDDPGDIIETYQAHYFNTTGLAWDGDLMWGIARQDRRLFALDPESGQIVENFRIHEYPTNLAFDGNNFWIGERWEGNCHIYDRNGEQLDLLEFTYFDGITTDQFRYIFLNRKNGGSGPTREILVLDLETQEQIAEISIIDLIDVDIDCIQWVPQHPDGQLWCLAEEHVYQLYIDENWNASIVQDFDLINEQEYTGISHDGNNLWHGMRNRSVWFKVADGIDEREPISWLEVTPESGELSFEESIDISLTFLTNQLEVMDYFGILNIYSNDLSQPLVCIDVQLNMGRSPRRFIDLNPTELNHTMWITDLSIGEETAPTGAEIAVFTPDSVLAGSMLWIAEDEPPLELLAYGDDPESDITEGFNAEESFQFRVWDNFAQREWNRVVVEFEEGPEIWTVEGNSTINVSVDWVGVPESEYRAVKIPVEFFVSPSYPNPFNSTTRITYGLPLASRVDVKLLDITGRTIYSHNVEKHAGIHDVIFEADGLSSGIYFVYIRAGKSHNISKIVLSK